MATSNYGWQIPVVNGDTGAWGTKVNQVFTEVDEDLKTVETKADTAQTTASSASTSAAAAYALATTVQTGLTNKVVVYTRAPTGSDTADNGTLWCQVSA